MPENRKQIALRRLSASYLNTSKMLDLIEQDYVFTFCHPREGEGFLAFI